MERKLTERRQGVRESSEHAVCKRYEAPLARSSPYAAAGDIAGAEAAERLAAILCDKELQGLAGDIDKSMREDVIAPRDAYAPHRLAVSLAFGDTGCCGNYAGGGGGGGAHN